jgi:aspartate aminotransferase
MKIPASIEISEKAQELKKMGIKVIDLSVGQPDFSPPLTEELIKMVLATENHSGYSSSYGTAELRALIASYLSSKQNIVLTINNIIVTPGAKLGLLYVISALCPKGSTILIPEPCWLSYQELAEFVGVGVQTVSSRRENHFIPTLNDILSTITSTTKAVLINNPVNPTGVCWPISLLKNLIEELRSRDIYLILDAIYDDFDFYDKIEKLRYFLPKAELKNLVYVHGFSKSHALTGHRLGYIASTQSLIRKISTIQSNLMTCPSTFSQRIAEQLLIVDQNHNILVRMNEFRERAQFVSKKLIEYEIPFIPPDGSFYILVDTQALSAKSAEASMILLEQYHLATVPGIAYGQSAEGYIRLSLTKPISVLTVAIKLLALALKKI